MSQNWKDCDFPKPEGVTWQDHKVGELFPDAETTQKVTAGHFELGLVLGGTVAAGAYTAGVLDFLFEALDAWSAAKAAAASPLTPTHHTLIKVIAGASGGGICGAITARALGYDYSHGPQAANPFYNVWVKQLDIGAMLSTQATEHSYNHISLLNPDALDKAAHYTITFAGAAPKARDYLAQPLTLLLTLTNLRGVPYKFIQFDNQSRDLSLQESFVNRADFVRFTVYHQPIPDYSYRPDEFLLTTLADAAGISNWPLLADYALATGAFPLVFPARALTRPVEDYRYRVTAQDGKILPIAPDWASLATADHKLPYYYEFLAVDGGVTDNEPLELARTALAGLLGRNPRAGDQANRALLLIDPFADSPATGPEDAVNASLFNLAKTIIFGLKDQARYATSDLLLATNPEIFSRFMITPHRTTKTGALALATTGLGGVLGFMNEAFRHHDYLLGRSNCWKFLKEQLVLPITNPLFTDWLQPFKTADGGYSPAFLSSPHLITNSVNGVKQYYLPIIPLVGACAVQPQPAPWPFGQFKPQDGGFPDALEQRIDFILGSVLDENLSGAAWLIKLLATMGKPAATAYLRDQILNLIIQELKDWELLAKEYPTIT